jgi:hypothetical protein
MSKGPATPKKRRSRLLALEPRVLFDGAVVDSAAALAKQDPSAAIAPAPAPDTSLIDAIDRATPAAVEAPAAAAPAEWLVIDGAVPDAAGLAAHARAGMNVLVLDPAQDGLVQIRDALAASGAPVSSLHIVSHGAPGTINLGSAQLDGAQLSARSGELQALRTFLTADADLRL